ncbi:MAG: phage scaffolding protein [Eubacterium sp.]
MALDKAFLEKAGIVDDAIETIINEHENDMNGEKNRADTAEAERDDFKVKFEAADTSLKDLKGKDVDGMEKELEAYKIKFDTLEKDVAKRDYDRAVSDYVSGYKFTSELAKKAAIAEIKGKELKLEDGKLLGADDLMNGIKTDNPGAFEIDNGDGKRKKPSFDSGTGDDSGTPMVYTREALEKMSPDEINTHWSDIQNSLKNMA